MPVLAADLIHPAGVLPTDWFPSADLDVWIGQGEGTVPVGATTAEVDAITTAYAYYRAHEAEARAILGGPDSVSLDAMSVSKSNGRAKMLLEQAAAYQAEWEAAVAAVGAEEEPEVSVPAPRSTAARIVYGF